MLNLEILDDTSWLQACWQPVDSKCSKWVVLSEQMLNYEAQPDDFLPNCLISDRVVPGEVGIQKTTLEKLRCSIHSRGAGIEAELNSAGAMNRSDVEVGLENSWLILQRLFRSRDWRADTVLLEWLFYAIWHLCVKAVSKTFLSACVDASFLDFDQEFDLCFFRNATLHWLMGITKHLTGVSRLIAAWWSQKFLAVGQEMLLMFASFFLNSPPANLGRVIFDGFHNPYFSMGIRLFTVARKGWFQCWAVLS